MAVNNIWGLQKLKTGLKGGEKEEFSRLESDLLNLLHQQRLGYNTDDLLEQINKIQQSLEVLSQKNMGKSFTALCIVPELSQSVSKSAIAQEPFMASLLQPSTQDQELYVPDTSVNWLTKFVPISYCYQKNEEDFPLITVSIDNTRSDKACLANISAWFEERSERARRQIKVQARTHHKVALLPVINKDQMKEIREQCAVTLNVEVEYSNPFHSIWPYTEKLFFLSRNTVLLWRSKEDGSLVDCTQGLASYITPRHPEIEKIVRQATNYLPGKGFRGYNVPTTSREKQAQEIREQVQAIFNVLYKEVKVTYVSSSRITQSQEDDAFQKTQHIRLPAEVIAAGGSANCIDGAVLFASLLENVNLRPLIFLCPGHALVGWYPFEGDFLIPEFLETTLIHTGDFELACAHGQKKYEETVALGTLGRSIIDPCAYALVVDVTDCRRHNIQPIDW